MTKLRASTSLPSYVLCESSEVMYEPGKLAYQQELVDAGVWLKRDNKPASADSYS
ncbi:hypothetical protein [Fibrella forsythiae]|uniref:Uncharacterized protein n=1 Tax=Fibrella forsythiae TaxID=2817061 RepID=A0ABS3JRC5_9BACT|nr:hypothetical protein [Fibrella forsythiae]MBO0952575.1 hypothetical protein [Fibrella forsythiae]